MIPVTVATVFVAANRFAPIDVVVAAGVDDNSGHPYVHLGPSRRCDNGSGGAKSQAAGEKNGTHELVSSNVTCGQRGRIEEVPGLTPIPKIPLSKQSQSR
jgi:hypothetical protein